MTRTPAEILRYEHGLHRRMLEVLDEFSKRVATGVDLEPGDIASVLGYFAEFVEGLHQVKEYEYLYPAAAMMEYARAAESVGRLIAEQHHTKMLFDSLRSFSDPADLAVDERVEFVKLAQAYAARLRWQMEREEEVLVLLGEFLGEKEAHQMLDQFAEAEEDQRCADDWVPEVERLETMCGL